LLLAASKIHATQQRLYNTDDAREGVRSFIEKRAARFTGR
jgi:enoyl-CoA hydratase/carnithine racemase